MYGLLFALNDEADAGETGRECSNHEQGHSQNILTQLHMGANEYNFISTIYFVSLQLL